MRVDEYPDGCRRCAPTFSGSGGADCGTPRPWELAGWMSRRKTDQNPPKIGSFASARALTDAVQDDAVAVGCTLSQLRRLLIRVGVVPLAGGLDRLELQQHRLRAVPLALERLGLR